MPRRTTTGADRAHARFAPSAAHRWLNCPGSIVLHEQMQAEPGYTEQAAGEAAVLGQTLHGFAETALNSVDDEGEPTYTGVSPEHRALIEPYINEVRAVVASVIELTGTDPDLYVEERFNTGIRDCWGTVDAAVVSQATREAWIIDLKTGHQRVGAENNTQLLIYALGLWKRHVEQLAVAEGQAGLDNPWRFHLKIVQPRDEEEPVKSWTCRMSSIHWIEEQIREVTRLFGRGFVAPRQLGDWCTYCPAASRCPDQIAQATSVFTSDQPASPSDTQLLTTTSGGNVPMATLNPEGLTEAQLAFFINNRAQIRAFLEACELRALQAPPPGWKVVAANTRRRWTDNEAVLRRLIADGHRPLIRQVPPTISDAERALGRNNPIITEFAVAPPGGPSLAPASDARPALDRTQVFRVEGAEGA